MKNGKKLLCFILAATMAIGLAACGDSNAPQKSSSTAVPSSTAGESSESSTAEEVKKAPYDKYEPIDMGGREFLLSYNWDWIPSTTSDVLPEDATLEQKHQMENLMRIEEKYNCKIKYINVPYDQVSEKLTTSVLAGDPYCDFVNLGAGQILPAVKGGELTDIKSIAPDNADMYNAKEVVYPGTLLGTDYAMVDVNLPIRGVFIVYNKDIISKLGLEDPGKLYADGQWDWEKFLEIAKAATKDTDGDGAIDQWGVSGTPGRMIPQFVAANGGFLLDDVNKKSGLDDPKTLETLEYINKLYNVEKVGYLLNDDASDYNNDNAFKDGKCALNYAELWMMPTADPKLPYNYGCVPIPKGPSNSDNTMFFADVSGLCVPKGVKNSEWHVQIYEELANWWGDDFSRKSDGTTTWVESMWQTDEDVEMVFEIGEKGLKYDLWSAIPEFPMGDVIADMMTNGKTPAQAVEASKQIAQDKVNAALS